MNKIKLIAIGNSDIVKTAYCGISKVITTRKTI